MKVGVLFAALLCWGLTAAAQVTGRLSGPKGLPVPYATVMGIHLPDSTLVRSGLADSTGAFELPAPPPGNYFVQVSAVDYTTWTSSAFTISTAAEQKDLGLITLKEVEGALNSVTVRGRPPLFQPVPGGTIVNPENSLLSKGSTVLAILERSPGVTIDHQNNEILLNGKSGVTVSIDGKTLRMPTDQVIALLGGMSGEELAKIELLSSPGAAYDAEGSAGVINLVLKKGRKRGLAGAFSLSGGYGYGEKGLASVNIEKTTSAVSAFGSYSFTHDHSYTGFVARATELEPLLGGQTNSVFSSVTHPLANNHNLTVGVDTKFGQKISTGASLNYLVSDVSAPTTNTGNYLVLPDSLYLLNAAITGTNHWRSLIADYYLQRLIGRTGQVGLDADYLDYDNRYQTNVTSSFATADGYPAGSNDTLFSPQVKTYSGTRIRVGVLRLDAGEDLTRNWRVETGLKGTYTQTAGVSGIDSWVNGGYTPEPAATNDRLMKEYIPAAYLSNTIKPDSALEIVAGLRYEYSRTRITQLPEESGITDRRLSEFFPNLTVSWKRKAGGGWDLSYARRISRPSYTDLASFVTYNGPTSVNTGNPLLLPTISNRLDLGWHHRGYSFGILLSRDDHPIVRYQLIESPDSLQLEVTPQNMVFENELSFRAGVDFTLGGILETTGNLTAGWRHFKEDFTPVPAAKTYFTYAYHGNETLRLPAGWTFELSGYYNGPYYNGSRKYDGLGVLNTGLRKTLPHQWGALQASVDDLLESGTLSSYFGALTQEVFNLKSHVLHHGEASKYRIFRLSYTRSFGTSPARKAIRSGDVEEEKGRIQ